MITSTPVRKHDPGERSDSCKADLPALKLTGAHSSQSVSADRSVVRL